MTGLTFIMTPFFHYFSNVDFTCLLLILILDVILGIDNYFGLGLFTYLIFKNIYIDPRVFDTF